MLLDRFLRLGLPLENLREQTYDGASSMSGEYTGTQVLIAKTTAVSSLRALFNVCR